MPISVLAVDDEGLVRWSLRQRSTEKPTLVDRALERTRSSRVVRRLRRREAEQWGAIDVVGVSPAMQQVKRLVSRVAAKAWLTVR